MDQDGGRNRGCTRVGQRRAAPAHRGRRVLWLSIDVDWALPWVARKDRRVAGAGRRPKEPPGQRGARPRGQAGVPVRRLVDLRGRVLWARAAVLGCLRGRFQSAPSDSACMAWRCRTRQTSRISVVRVRPDASFAASTTEYDRPGAKSESGSPYCARSMGRVSPSHPRSASSSSGAVRRAASSCGVRSCNRMDTAEQSPHRTGPRGQRTRSAV